MKKPRIIAITPGDPDGIGPEVVWKAIRTHHRRWKGEALLCVGARAPFERLKAKVIPADPERLIPPPKTQGPYVWLLEAPEQAVKSLFLPGFQAGWSIERAARLVQTGTAQALVTGPIHKGRLQAGGYKYQGHTDFLADLCGGVNITMMLANSHLRVSLVTVHCALSEVPGRITKKALERATHQTYLALREQWGIKKPKIALCGLNPHSGEGGLFGKEETKVITPFITWAKKKYAGKAEISGPHPSDTLFAMNSLNEIGKRYDAVVAMYHDQGLIPVKLLDFPRTVNLTLGLPIIRTSVDHGTAFDIAWKNKADASSFVAALDLAREFIQVKEKRK